MCCAADLSETVFTCSPVPGAKGRERRFGVERPRSRRATAPLQAALLSQRSASAPAWSPECKCSRQRAASGLAALQLALTARLPAASAPRSVSYTFLTSSLAPDSLLRQPLVLKRTVAFTTRTALPDCLLRPHIRRARRRLCSTPWCSECFTGLAKRPPFPPDWQLSECFELGVCSRDKMGVPDVIGGPLPISLSHLAMSAVMGALAWPLGWAAGLPEMLFTRGAVPEP